MPPPPSLMVPPMFGPPPIPPFFFNPPQLPAFAAALQPPSAPPQAPSDSSFFLDQNAGSRYSVSSYDILDERFGYSFCFLIGEVLLRAISRNSPLPPSNICCHGRLQAYLVNLLFHCRRFFQKIHSTWCLLLFGTHRFLSCRLSASSRSSCVAFRLAFLPPHGPLVVVVLPPQVLLPSSFVLLSSLFLSPFCLFTVLLSSSFCLLTVLLSSSFVLLSPLLQEF
ncbi:hypothetical protein NQ318_015772 [Aromia moschata]|uniref:Uncharacterized protein n=1 Tax=Aromia moschata TaxID=1265417 RepID=A0AAV8XP48_9CUCU|nr:hypothetical protein NQ318_015772 [Aromia moschata]